jgi:O-antigen/teichoic acid export membrane protein
MNSQSSVAKGAMSLYVANMVVFFANTLYFLVLTNLLKSTVDVGIITALNIMTGLFVIICLLAQPVTAAQSPIAAPVAVLKFIPELLVRGARSGVVRAFRFSAGLTAFLGISISAILLVVPQGVIPLLGGGAVLPLFVRLAALDFPFSALGQVCLGTLIALGFVKKASGYAVLGSLVRYGASSILLVWYGVAGVLVGFILGDVFTFAITFNSAWRPLHQTSGADSDGISSRELGLYSAYTFVSAFMGFLITQTDKIFALFEAGLSELAVYNVAIVASSVVRLAPFALLAVLLPALSSLSVSDKTAEIRNTVRVYTRYVSLVVVPMALGFAALSPLALRLFGSEYLGGLLPSVVVSVATGLSAVGIVYASMLVAMGELKWYTAANLLGLFALFVISAAATQVLGLTGPALGRAGLMFVTVFVYAFAVRKKGFSEFDSKAYAASAVASAVMAAIIFTGVSLVHSFRLQLVALPAFIVGGLIIYLGMLRGLRVLTAADLEFARETVPKRFHKIVKWVELFVSS